MVAPTSVVDDDGANASVAAGACAPAGTTRMSATKSATPIARNFMPASIDVAKALARRSVRHRANARDREKLQRLHDAIGRSRQVR
jgi:hypothetical protein